MSNSATRIERQLDPHRLLEGDLELADVRTIAGRAGMSVTRVRQVVDRLRHVRRWPASAVLYVVQEALAAIDAARPRLAREAPEEAAQTEATQRPQREGSAKVRAAKAAEAMARKHPKLPAPPSRAAGPEVYVVRRTR